MFDETVNETHELPDLGTRTSYLACPGCHATYELTDPIAQGRWTQPDKSMIIGRACPACGARPVEKVRVAYPRVTKLDEMVVGGEYYCVDTYHDKEPFGGQQFMLVEGLHECGAYPIHKQCLKGQVVSWPDARKICEPLYHFGLVESHGPDFYETYRVR